LTNIIFDSNIDKINADVDFIDTNILNVTLSAAMSFMSGSPDRIN